jgi:hypothetical protein
MKLFTLALLFVVTSASAQWSNTTNLFYDSLHMAVSNAAQAQLYTLVVRSYPDSGYFVIWQDYRNDPSGFSDHASIYAQKYDKAGNRLWTADGVPVAIGASNVHYVYNSNDYRDHHYAATDSAGGFYIGYADDSVTNVTYQRACIQHMRSDGTAVFTGSGFVIGSTPAAGTSVQTQLIADGAGGAYVAFTLTTTVLHAYDYKDVGGAMVDSTITTVGQAFSTLVNVYPNPVTNNSVTVGVQGFNKDERVMVSLYDLLGRRLYEYGFVADDNGTLKTPVSFNRLASQMYVIRIKGDAHGDITRALMIR